jgi:hypothetical protein
MVTTAERHPTYAALSYVCGSAEVSQLRLTEEPYHQLASPGSLEDTHADIPTTIKDASHYAVRYASLFCVLMHCAFNKMMRIYHHSLV